MIGGIFALKRKNYGIVVAGSLVGIFSFGLILAIVALFVLLLASDEFYEE
ncbi:MAG: hypothetical protein ACOC85_04655 [Thermoplasmatota archaeon]